MADVLIKHQPEAAAAHIASKSAVCSILLRMASKTAGGSIRWYPGNYNGEPN